jgi:nucleoside-diphosphate-sugar epimerase
MKIFVTGSTGFVGKHVVKLLAEKGHELKLLVRNESSPLDAFPSEKDTTFIIGDLSNTNGYKAALEDFKSEAVLHLAWEGLPDYNSQKCLRNLEYGTNLFNAAAEAGCNCIIAVGSCWEYTKATGPMNEESPLESTTDFSAAKNSLRLAGEAISKKYDIKFYWPRIFYVYGPGQRDTSLIPYIIRSFLNRIGPEVENPDNKNDFVYVKDAAEAIVGIIEKKPADIAYNIGSGHAVSVQKIISITSEIMKCKFDIDDASGSLETLNSDNFWADISKIQKDIGWFPKYSLTDGIRETVQYYIKCREGVAMQ